MRQPSSVLQRLPVHLSIAALVLAASLSAPGGVVRRAVAPAGATPAPAAPSASSAPALSAPAPSAGPAARPADVPTAAVASPPPAPDFERIRPNELGQIMVLEYHEIGDEELRWTRSRENFRHDLEYLYQHDYYLSGLNELLDNRVRAPAGKTPVVLTFDDSNRSQFQLVADADGTLRVAPDSGLGILEGFIGAHPDFGRAAVFCILPAADPPNDLFGQPEYRAKKLQYLVEHGYELCNHTYWHANLQQISREEIVRQLALTAKVIQDAVPGYQVNVFNPPMGLYPDDLSALLAGSYQGVSYQHRAILKVDEGVLTAPNDRATDLLHIPRLQAIPEVLERWFATFEKHPEQRYVSDGDPDRVVFPAELGDHYLPVEGAHEEPSPDPRYRVIRLR